MTPSTEDIAKWAAFTALSEVLIRAAGVVATEPETAQAKLLAWSRGYAKDAQAIFAKNSSPSRAEGPTR